MRSIELVSAAVIAMAAMAGTVAASAPPAIEFQGQVPPEERMQDFSVRAEQEILASVSLAEEEGASGEAAQQRITGYLQDFIRTGRWGFGVYSDASETEMYIFLDRARRSLINSNQLRRGSDGDLAVSAVLAAREAEERSWAERNLRSRGGYDRGRGGETLQPRQAPAAGQGSPTAGDAGRNVPGNAAAGQPATDAGTTEVQQTQTTNDPDLDDEAGEPD